MNTSKGEEWEDMMKKMIGENGIGVYDWLWFSIKGNDVFVMIKIIYFNIIC